MGFKIDTKPNRPCGFCLYYGSAIIDVGVTTVDYVPICNTHKHLLEKKNYGWVGHKDWRTFVREHIKLKFPNTQINKHRLEGGGTAICEVSHHHYWTDHKYITDDDYSLCIYCFGTKKTLETTDWKAFNFESNGEEE